MPEPFKLTRIPALKTVADFRAHCAALGIELPCEDAIETGVGSPLAQPVPDLTVNGKRIGNRVAIHPMEGCDGTTTGGLSEEMRRRWQRFGESGAKLICGAEAMAVRPDGRANPNQLIISEPNQAGLAELVGSLKKPTPSGTARRTTSSSASAHALRPQLQAAGQKTLRVPRAVPASDPRPEIRHHQRRAGVHR